MGEFAWIAKLREALGEGLAAPQGIGDDAAWLPERAGGRVVATDVMVEGVHFRRDWSSLADVAYKLYASNASDMWAMGAAPQEWLLTVVAPSALPDDETAALCEGFRAAQRVWGAAPLVGGDTARGGGPLTLSVTMTGALSRAPWRRDGFVPGDRLWVDGPLGLASAGLALLAAGEGDASNPCVRQQLRPQRRHAAVDFDARGAIDVSDGLSADLWHVARASGVALVLDAPLPGRALLRAAADALGLAEASRDAQMDAWQLTGGEDYVRVVGASHCPGEGWRTIGYVEAGSPQLWDARAGDRVALDSEGWDHFST